ncbi:uncharacterized protein Bfra_010926 [Botrytis fragariae]|uniref:2EXR domain-containing protein n=1 Tax=Botrytis fragariae TaxID=1964551 RepID=A0A8H6ALE0_9HELO|nr:uncharacterized protein Bfra_010926 [Botrytis fragariae]KAF5869726.1 hypothetical protein Bfra_010926 [Botrytis fragariae]
MSELEATSRSFMKVPEMRLAIWEALVPPPRRIYMQRSSMSLGDNRCWVAKVNSDSGSPTIPNPPVLIGICAESRDYFIREKGYTIFSCCLMSPIYVNYSKDQLWFESLSRLWGYARNVSYQDRQGRRNSQMNEEVLQLSRIKKLGMSLTDKDKIGRFSARIMIHIIKRLPELEEVIFELPKDRFDDYKANVDGKLSSFEERIRGHNILDPRAPPRLIFIMQEVVVGCSSVMSAQRHSRSRMKSYLQCVMHDWNESFEQVGKLETIELSKAIDPKRISNDHSEAFTLFTSLGPELRIAMCELAVAAATPTLLELIYPFPYEPEHPEDCLKSAKWAYRQLITTSNLLMNLNTTRFSRVPRRGIKIYGLLYVPIISPMLFRPSVDFLSFHDMHDMKECTDMGTPYKFYQNSGVKVKRSGQNDPSALVPFFGKSPCKIQPERYGSSSCFSRISNTLSSTSWTFGFTKIHGSNMAYPDPELR